MRRKTTRAWAALATAVLFTLQAQAYTHLEETRPPRRSVGGEQQSLAQANLVKINLPSLVLNNVSLQYERLLMRKISVAVGLRFMPERKLPFANTLLNVLGEPDPQVRDLLDFTRIDGFAITPEFRFYLGSYGKGVYLAPFLRYETFGLHSRLQFSTGDNVYPIQFDGRFSRIGGGILLGAQHKLARQFYLDWWITGPYVGSAKTSLKAQGFEIAEEDYDEYVQYINGLEIQDGFYKTKIEMSRTHAHISANGILPAVRFGLALAYRF